jgi:hypothetical protein
MSPPTIAEGLGRPRAVSAIVDADRLRVALQDGREVSVPVTWFDWLAGATDAQRHDVRIIEGGVGIWWEQLDDGVSVPWLFGLPEWP